MTYQLWLDDSRPLARIVNLASRVGVEVARLLFEPAASGYRLELEVCGEAAGVKRFGAQLARLAADESLALP